MAPEIPTAMYSSGATILPVFLTWNSFGTNPASRGAGRAHSGTERTGDRLEQREVITILHPAATGNNNPGGGEFRRSLLDSSAAMNLQMPEAFRRWGRPRSRPSPLGRDRVEELWRRGR